MRTLTVIPMVHTPEELGIFEHEVMSVHTRIYGAPFTEQFFADVHAYWEEVRRRIEHADYGAFLHLAKLHIFIDGLPNVADDVVEYIIADHCQKKFPVYLIAAALRIKGAYVHGTEDITLLLSEHAYWKAVIEKRQQPDPEKEKMLLKERDIAIARRINEVVPDEERALLFIGKPHDVAAYFKPADAWTIVDL